MMIRNVFVNISKRKSNNILVHRYSKAVLDIEKLEQDSVAVKVVDSDVESIECAIQEKRNKSRLSPAHRNILMGKPPYPEPMHWTHDTLRYHRKLYGKYGSESGVNIRVCWPTKEELSDMIEYERVAFPFTIPEMIEVATKKKLEKEAAKLKRDEEVSNKMLKLDMWIKELNNKVAKKQAEARAAKERKEKLLEEVRRHFGYTVDPRDDKFKEMLEKKEKEQQKAMKAARKKAKQEELITKVLSKKEDKIKSNIEKSSD